MERSSVRSEFADISRKKGAQDAKSKRANNIIVAVSALVVIVCLGILGVDLYHTYEAKKNHENIKNMYSTAQHTVIEPAQADLQADAPADTAASQSGADTVEEVVYTPREILPAAQELLAINPDTVGFVSIPDCVYEPVVKGTDNDYYLTHNFYGAQRSCGTCFADYRNIVGDRERSDNIILYAHNQKDGTMFGNLDYYRWDPAYWLKNPFIYFNTNYSEDAYVIISSFVVNSLPESDNGNLFDYNNYIDFAEDEGSKYSFAVFAKEITERSHIITGVPFDESDEYITLSTCSTEWDDSRHVIVARKLRDGETTDNFDTTNFAKNPDPKWPAIYYKYHGGSWGGDQSAG
ncbi:MAG: class B sortase [Oscillospiraceae bacterium]|nr:class B sortase [Oscillospiraceae bacterium]